MAMTDLSKRIRSINAKILNAEKRLGKDNRVVQYVYKTIEQSTGKKGATRFSMPKDSKSLRTLSKLDRGLKQIESSKWLSKKGREEIVEKARESFSLSHEEYTDKEVEEFYWFFKQDIYSKLREVSLGQSEFVIDAIGDMRRQGISKKRVVEIMKDYITNNNDLSFREYADMIMYNDE